MKKIISMILVLILMFTLVSCTRPFIDPSSTPLNMADISTPELNGITYTAYGIQFEIKEDWVVEVDGIYTDIYFNNYTSSCMTFSEPMYTGVGQLTKTEIEHEMEIYAENREGNVTIADAYQVIVDNEKVWVIDVFEEISGVELQLTFWIYRTGSDTYMWSYIAPFYEYEVCLPYVQALIKSMKLP